MAVFGELFGVSEEGDVSEFADGVFAFVEDGGVEMDGVGGGGESDGGVEKG